MASIGKTKGGKGTLYYIQLSPGEHSQRPIIRLGKCTKNDAVSTRVHIENLVRNRKNGVAIPVTTAEWLENLPGVFRERLEKLGLAASQVSKQSSLDDWVRGYIKRRPDVKEATRRKWRDVEDKLNTFFRGSLIGEITVQQAKSFRVYLQTTVNLGENTIRRHIGITRQFFNSAVDAELITKNPFRGQPVSVRANESRFFYVTPEIAEKVLAACPNAEWRLIFGLARYGGLRCPSEVVALKWTDIDFEKQRFTVHASKTEHHGDGGIRVVPIFPELKPLFQDAFDNAPEGAVYCVHRCNGQWSNLGALLSKIVKRAGLELWPKLMQNLRSTRETELFKLTGGNIKAVCSWIGNSPEVAMQHYAQVTDADYREAAKMTIIGQAEQALQNPMQQAAKSCRTASHEPSDDIDVSLCVCETKPQDATGCDDMQKGGNWAIRDSNPGPAD